ncbi:Hypp6883 [Branchiostoma lanceolatum]|uniref:Hypp6883 protein n=1 Tax=Branchiostoma lanceolatum TaxID=7740 RepID=A0A8J9YVL1_BRALA|nr:Hypp6883 [Branchiostoma lanceolatum]
MAALQKLADGLVHRYQHAGQPPPILLYTDRDCCSESGPSKFKALFSAWDKLEVRLDIWHFMRRLAVGCTMTQSTSWIDTLGYPKPALLAWDVFWLSRNCSGADPPPESVLLLLVHPDQGLVEDPPTLPPEPGLMLAKQAGEGLNPPSGGRS